MYFLKSRLYILVLIILTAIFLYTVSCNKQDNTVSNPTDSLIIPMPNIVHADLSDSLSYPVKVKFRVLKGDQVMIITPQINYLYLNGDSMLSYYTLIFPDIQINGLNHFQDVDTLIRLGHQVFFDDHFNSLVNFGPGDQWIISYWVYMNNGRYLRNKFESIVTWDNYFSGLYNDHLLYYKPGSSLYPNDAYIDSSFIKDLIAINPGQCEMHFALWGSSGARMIIEPWYDSVTIPVSGWKYPVMNGDPNNSSLITHIDEKSDKVNKIYLYYYFKDSTGNNNIFWETLTPQ